LNISSNKSDELDAENVVADHMSFNLENLRKTYLFVYNLWQFLGFTYIFSTLIFKYSKLGSGKFIKIYLEYTTQESIYANYALYLTFLLGKTSTSSDIRYA
jgi:hypothetical protein